MINQGLDEEELFNLTDFGLLGRLEVSQDSGVRFYYERLMKGIVPKITLEFKSREDLSADLVHKPMRIIGLGEDVFDGLIASPHFHDVAKLEALEHRIAETVGIPKEHLIIVPPFSKNRFEPKDMNVYSREGKISQLSDIYPDHFKAMREYGRSHLSLRISVYEEHREKVYKQADRIKEVLLGLDA